MNDDLAVFRKMSTFKKEDDDLQRPLIFFSENYKNLNGTDEPSFDVQRLLEPITAVLETVLNASFGQF